MFWQVSNISLMIHSFIVERIRGTDNSSQGQRRCGVTKQALYGKDRYELLSLRKYPGARGHSRKAQFLDYLLLPSPLESWRAGELRS